MLGNLVTLLHKIGYGPTLNFSSLHGKKEKKDHSIHLKLGLAAFCSGNTMLLAFPDYFTYGEEIKEEFGSFFGYLSIALALPVLFYSARGFFESAWQSLKQKHVNLDTPISMGLAALFLVSLYDILWAGGPGYLDSCFRPVFSKTDRKQESFRN